jgi:hypothetical protein
MPGIDYSQKIPNNVDLASDKKLQRALEAWQPNYLDWWSTVGPSDFNTRDVYLRTAINVGSGGWAHFGFVKRPDYRWGIFLEPRDEKRTIGFGDHLGQPAWQHVPGEYRNWLRRLIVTQADTEPASVEQQRLLGHTAPSQYDLRNLFQVNVEEGRHRWAMARPPAAATARGSGGAFAAQVGQRRPPAHPLDVQRAVRGLALVPVLHDVHGPRRQVPAARAGRVGLRSAGAHVPLHAHRGSAPHVRRPDRRRPRHRAHVPGDEVRQDV